MSAASSFARIVGPLVPVALVGADAEPDVVVDDPDHLAVDVVLCQLGQDLAPDEVRARLGRGLGQGADEHECGEVSHAGAVPMRTHPMPPESRG